MNLIILVIPNFNLAATMSFLDPFRAANYLEGEGMFSWRLASLDGGPCPASNGAMIMTEALSSISGNFDLVIMSSSWAPEQFFKPRLLAFLQKMAASGSTMGALDTGAFLLARAGLLKGRRATVHYEHIDAMAEMFPDVDVREELFVFDGKRITCCGGAAATDFALQIIHKDQGGRLSSAAARYIFHREIRGEGARQNPEFADPLGNTIPSSVRRAIAEMERHLEVPVPIPQICAEVRTSQRQLDRLFKRYVGKAPASYYSDIRLDRARGLVTQTEMPLSAVAIASGFAGHAQFSRAYRERFGLRPSDDRVQGRIPFEYRAWPMHPKRKPTTQSG